MNKQPKYLHRKTVNGKTYVFLRYKGKLTALPGNETSEEFRLAYDRALRQARLATAATPAARPAPLGDDTLHAAIAKYLDSAVFAAKAESTKVQYRHTLRQLGARLGRGKLADLDTDAVEILMDELAKKHGTSVADRHKAMLSAIWQVCRKWPQFAIKGKGNPTTDAEDHYQVQKRHRPWPPDVQEAFMAGASTQMRLTKLLLHFSVQRGCDAVRMRWEDYDGRGISVRQRKTHGERDALADYYILPRPLREALDAAPRVGDTILVNEFGRPYANANVLSHAIKRELVRLGLAQHGERTWTMHGLRKTGASEVGSLGVGAAGIKSVGGWRTDSEANYYAQDADKRQINASVVNLWDEALKRRAR